VRRSPQRHDPYPPEAFHRGDNHWLRVGSYRIVYMVEDDLITIERADALPDLHTGMCSI
jgi:mRNA-degrading endonuclease RelE of RelBE toxin-antitoxin system